MPYAEGDTLQLDGTLHQVFAPPVGLRWAKVKTITFADAPADGAIVDVATLLPGTILDNLLVRVRTAFDGDSDRYVAFGIGLNPAVNPKWLFSDTVIGDAPSVSWDLSVADDDARLSGLQDEFSDAVGKGGVNSGNGYFPTFALQSVVIQAKFLIGGTSPTVGEADIWLRTQAP